ncbi:MAG: phospholipid carrier-dependent glycosyltransferase [Polyangiaceae bacterium]|nr:phospholipid carrier-dependent glycosyltransferase [Polyangiaceae bacterium]
MRRTEVLLWMAAAALQWTVVAWLAGAVLGNDSFQYLSIADSLVSGEGLVTPIVFYDTEASHGTIPAPVSTFPPLFPVLVALPHLLGVALPVAALFVTVACSVVLIPVLVSLAGKIGASVFWTRVVLLFVLLSDTFRTYARSIVAEPPFTLLLTSAALAVVLAERARAQGALRERGWLLVAAVLAGTACLVRYAGYFLVLGLVSYFALGLLRSCKRPEVMRVVWVSPSVVPPLWLLLRNWNLTRTLSGGNTKHVVRGAMDILRGLAYSPGDLVFGQPAWIDSRGRLVLMFLLVGYGVYWWHRTGGRSSLRRDHTGLLAFVAWVALVYAGSMTLSGAFMVFTFYARMFYPLLPLGLVGLAVCATQWTHALRSSRPQAALSVGVGGLVALCNGASLASTVVRGDTFDSMHACLSEPTEDGRSLVDVVNARVPAGARFAATNGQAALFVLDRPGLALAESEYSERTWEEARLREAMYRFALDYLVLFLRDEPAVQRESRFLSALAAKPSSTWLRETVRNGCALVLLRAETPPAVPTGNTAIGDFASEH